MTTLTKSQIALRLLQKMGVVGAGQTASSSDQEKAEEKISTVHDHLCSINKVRWSLAAVPEYAGEAYALMASVLAGPDFGYSADPGAWLAGTRIVSAGIAVPPSADPIQSESF